MAIFLRSNFPDIFNSRLAAIDTIYMQSRDLDESKAPWKKIFAVKSSDRQFENVTGFTGFPKFGSVNEAEEVPLMNAAQLFDKKFTHTKFAGAWQISEEMEDDDQDEWVGTLANAFARSYRFTKEVDMSNVLNNGSTTELAADGSAVYATHTLYNGSTFVNGVATDFGISAAQTMFNYFATLTDDQGIRIHLSPAYIVANPAMRWVVGETMRSESKPFTTDNEINVLNEETLKEIYWPEVTDNDAWYVFAKPSDVHSNGLRMYDRQEFTVSTDFDVRNLTMISVGRGRWSRGVIDWRQTYGSTGA